MRYKAIFSGETNPKQKLSKIGLLFVSIPFHTDTDNNLQEKIDKFEAGADRLMTATDQLDCLLPNLLNRHNYEMVGQSSEEARTDAMELEHLWKIKYNFKTKLENKVKDCLSWEKDILENENYVLLHKYVRQMYQDNTHEFKQKVDSVIGTRISYLASLKNIDLIFAAHKCLEYTLEECTAVLIARTYEKYDSLFYIQGKLNEPTQMMAATVFNMDDPIFGAINAHPLEVKIISRFDSSNSRSSKTKSKRNEFFNPDNGLEKEQNSLHSAELSLEIRFRLTMQAFFDSPAISSEQKLALITQISQGTPPTAESIVKLTH